MTQPQLKAIDGGFDREAKCLEFLKAICANDIETADQIAAEGRRIQQKKPTLNRVK